MSAAKTFTLLRPDRVPYDSATPGALGGHRRNRIYGRLDCADRAWKARASTAAARR